MAFFYPIIDQNLNYSAIIPTHRQVAPADEATVYRILLSTLENTLNTNPEQMGIIFTQQQQAFRNLTPATQKSLLDDLKHTTQIAKMRGALARHKRGGLPTG
jgi:hypothetical protein